jgi:hypothetical protein
MSRFDKFDKPFRILPTFDERKGLELFNMASKLDTHELLQYSLVNQIPLDYTNGEGECLIHEVINIDGRKASEHAKLNVIKFLVQNKVNPDKSNKNNQTPLHLACIQQLSIIVEYLLGLGVNPNFQDNMGNTPLHYLLTGLIKTIDVSNEVMDWVPPPKKQNLELVNKTVEIKKLLWDYINKLELPMLKSLENTIDNILKVDKDIVDRQLETNKLILKLASGTSSEDKSAEIKDLIQITKKSISDKIMGLFDKLPDLPNFNIHTKTKTSWSPILSKSLSLISNGNIKSEVKRDMERIRKELVDMSDNFTPIQLFNNEFEEDGFEDLMINKVIGPVSIDTRDISGDGAGNCYYENPRDPGTRAYIQLDDDQFNKTNDEIRHWLALDNASDIIDFDKLKYMGGPREMTITDTTSWTNLDYYLSNIKNNSWEENQVVLSLLSFIDLNSEIAMIPPNFDFIDNLNVFDNPAPGRNFYSLINAGIILIPGYDLMYVDDYCFYLIMAYTAIFNPARFDEIQNIIPSGSMGLKFANNKFAQKWFGIYKKTVNIGSWIYSMWGDIICKFSQSNLEGEIKLNMLVAIAGLVNNKTNKIQSIINVYKPHLIKHIFTTEKYAPIRLAKVIIILMNFNIDKDFTDGIGASISSSVKSDKNAAARTLINGLNISNELKDFGTLLLDWYTFMHTYINDKIKTSTNSNFVTTNKLYKQFENPGDNPENVIIKIILSLNEQADNKLLNQTIIDLVYLVKNINTIDTKSLYNSISNFANLSGLTWLPGLTGLFGPDIKKNLMPGEYSKLNHDFDGASAGLSHIKIAHVLGLHYQGMVYKSDFNLNMGFTVDLTSLGLGINTFYLSDYTLGAGYYHCLNGDQLEVNQLPSVLNYVWLNNSAPAVFIVNQLTPTSKYVYYNVEGRDFRIPTHNACANALIERIHYYQNKINNLIKRSTLESVESIIDEMINGNTNKLSKLYLEIYPELVLYSNILSGLIESYNELVEHYNKNTDFKNLNPIKLINKPIKTYDYIKLATGLNKINSNYYIYYYLYQPGKLIGLSRFNYYQIPIEFPTKSFYYEGTNVTAKPLVNISSGTDQTIVNLDGNRPTNDHKDPSNNQLKMLNEGYINNFKIGNYSNILNDYTNMKLPTSNFTSKNDFIILKSSPLPPSLYNALNDFYKYVLIELVKRVLTKIEAGKSADPEMAIFNKSNEIIRTTGIAVEEYELTTYSFVMKIVQELVKEQISIYINNAVVKKYNEFIEGKVSPKLKSPIILATKDMTINLSLTAIKPETITKKSDVKNLFSLVINPVKNPIEPFVLYPNDLTNINKLRSKYGIIINPQIVKIMMKSSASPYASNADGYTTIFPIIKNYNYKLIQTLKADNFIDFRSFNDSPLHFIQKENLNNIDKVLGSVDISNITIKNLLGNIDGYLYNDVKSMITANELFGNNILLYLPESFNISTYLTLQYLSESLEPNSNVDFNLIDFENIKGLIPEITFANLDKNFLGEKLGRFKVPREMNIIIINQLIEEKNKELANIKDKITNLDKKDDELKKGDSSVYARINIKSSPLYSGLSTDKLKLETEIKSMEGIRGKGKNLANISGTHNINDLITSYQDYNKADFENVGPMIKAWSTLLEDKLKLNYNLVPIYVLDKQKKLIETINVNNLEDLVKIEKVMGHWALCAESYFTNKKYTENNQTLKFIEQLLNYITRMVIGNGIELMMRRILMTWLFNANASASTNNYDEINDIIEYILESDLTGKTDNSGAPTNMRKELYEKVCPNFVKNSAEIFENKSEEQAHYVQNTKEILLNYFQLLDLTAWGSKIPNEIKNVFIVQVTNYFDTIISKSILLWFVNVENILKLFINNYRCLKTMMELIG